MAQIQRVCKAILKIFFTHMQSEHTNPSTDNLVQVHIRTYLCYILRQVTLYRYTSVLSCATFVNR